MSFPATLSLAQEADLFDPIAVGAQLDEVSERLGAEDVAPEFLTEARATVVVLDAAAAACRQQSTEERQRLKVRFEPLADIGDDVAPAVFDQRVEIRRLLDEAIDRQTRCSSVKDYTEALLARITETQNQLSQQYLSNRNNSVIVLLREMPARLTAWPGLVKSAVPLTSTWWRVLRRHHYCGYWWPQVLSGQVSASGYGTISATGMLLPVAMKCRR